MDSPKLTDTLTAEKAVIGSALNDQSAIRWAADHITAEDFSSPKLGEIWRLIYARWKSKEPTDVVSMDSIVRQHIPGITPAELFDLVDASPVGGSAAYWAEQIAEGAKRRRLVEMATRARQNALEADLSDALTIARADLEAVGTSKAKKIDAKPLSQVLDGEDDYDWVIPGILERRDRLVLTGGEGAGKSTLIRQMAICTAAGLNPLTFHDMTPAKVLVIDAENSEKQWRRATRNLVQHASEQARYNVGKLIPIACVPRLDITTERDLSAIHDLIDEHKPDILFIGPLYRLIPRAIQSDDDAAPLLTALDSLRARGPALVMEAHAGHAQSGTGVRDLRPRGSSALLGWPEFGIGLRLDTNHPAWKANPHYRKVDLTRWRGDRDERAFPESLYAGNCWPWTPENYAITSSYPNPQPQEP